MMQVLDLIGIIIVGLIGLTITGIFKWYFANKKKQNNTTQVSAQEILEKPEYDDYGLRYSWNSKRDKFYPIRYAEKNLKKLSWPFRWEMWVDKGPENIITIRVINVETNEVTIEDRLSLTYHYEQGNTWSVNEENLEIEFKPVRLYSYFENPNRMDKFESTYRHFIDDFNKKALELNLSVKPVEEKADYRIVEGGK